MGEWQGEQKFPKRKLKVEICVQKSENKPKQYGTRADDGEEQKSPKRIEQELILSTHHGNVCYHPARMLLWFHSETCLRNCLSHL